MGESVPTERGVDHKLEEDEIEELHESSCERRKHDQLTELEGRKVAAGSTEGVVTQDYSGGCDQGGRRGSAGRPHILAVAHASRVYPLVDG